MTLWNPPQITEDMGLSELREIVASLVKDIDFIINGNLDSKNAREIGGWLVGLQQLVSKDGDVGLSTEDTSGDDIRLFAGASGGNKETAPFKVRKSGKMEATGALIQSTAGYPKVVLDPNGNLLGAYTSPGNYVAINPDDAGAPAIQIFDGGLIRLSLKYTVESVVFFIPRDVIISSTAGSIYLSPGISRFVAVPNWSSFLNEASSQTLQQALNAKANAFSGASGSFPTVDGRTVIVSNGIIASIF